jgi:hypothetical protein
MNSQHPTETQLTPSDTAGSRATPAEGRSWAPPAWPSDNFTSPRPLRKRAIGWRGGR